MYSLHFTDVAKLQYDGLTGKLLAQVNKGLARIVARPFSGKPLRGELRGIYSERVATFRILYKIKSTEVEVLILTIEHRKSVYGGH